LCKLGVGYQPPIARRGDCCNHREVQLPWMQQQHHLLLNMCKVNGFYLPWQRLEGKPDLQ
jgi:hypothetical protein